MEGEKNRGKAKFSDMNWFYNSWFYWSFTVLLLGGGIAFTIMLVTADRVTNWIGYIIGPAFLLQGLIQIPWYFIVKKNEEKTNEAN